VSAEGGIAAEEKMFNSPLHYCALCKQYVELDQSAQECALQHGCKVDACPFTHLFKPATSTSDEKAATPAATPEPD
jgi:hypothetical protein